MSEKIKKTNYIGMDWKINRMPLATMGTLLLIWGYHIGLFLTPIFKSSTLIPSWLKMANATIVATALTYSNIFPLYNLGSFKRSGNIIKDGFATLGWFVLSFHLTLMCWKIMVFFPLSEIHKGWLTALSMLLPFIQVICAAMRLPGKFHIHTSQWIDYILHASLIYLHYRRNTFGDTLAMTAEIFHLASVVPEFIVYRWNISIGDTGLWAYIINALSFAFWGISN